MGQDGVPVLEGQWIKAAREVRGMLGAQSKAS